MYPQIKQLLCERLPRLKELSFGCEFQRGLNNFIYVDERHALLYDKTVKKYAHSRIEDMSKEILGHDFSHYDIVEALGEEWAITGEGQLLKKQWQGGQEFVWLYYEVDAVGDLDNFPKLPSNLHDLDNPEYEPTANRLLELLTNLPE